ncbi:MAG: hypothetical protein AAF483_08915, partial [Planctomycetota bacterium]
MEENLAPGYPSREIAIRMVDDAYGILDKALDADTAYTRYLKFRGVQFPAVPEGDWHHYFCDLVQLEHCFVIGDALGHVVDYPFSFEVVDERP